MLNDYNRAMNQFFSRSGIAFFYKQCKFRPVILLKPLPLLGIQPNIGQFWAIRRTLNVRQTLVERKNIYGANHTTNGLLE